MKSKLYLLVIALAIIFLARGILRAECSTILVLDISTSMNEDLDDALKIDIEKNLAMDWIISLNMQNSEAAVVTFCGDAIGLPQQDPKPIRPFTAFKDSLLYAIDNLPDLCSGTNYNAAFLHRNGYNWWGELSALHYCKPDVARYKPVIVFITDGNHLSKWGGPIRISEIFSLAKQRNAHIYVVVLDGAEISDDNLEALKQLASAEGEWQDNLFMNVKDPSELDNIIGCKEFTSVEEKTTPNKLTEIVAYPNPTSDEITLNIPSQYESSGFIATEATVTLCNYMGEKIKKETFKNLSENSEITISLDDVHNGGYYLIFNSKYVREIVPIAIVK